MPEFDANEDPLRLTGGGKDEPLEPAVIRPRFMPRARELAYAHCYARREARARQIGSAPVARRRRAARRACPSGRRVVPLGAPPRRRRRLWTTCHGRPPGSSS